MERSRREWRFDFEHGLQGPDRLGYVLAVGFIWFWCSWMSFGVWAFALGKFFLEGEVVPPGEDASPWPLEMYLGIPVAATFGGLITFYCFGGIRWLRRRLNASR
jgi:hypothetical protein